MARWTRPAGALPGGKAPPNPVVLAVLLLAVVVPSASLAGCISRPSETLTVRPGDLVRAEIVVLDGATVLLPEGRLQDLCSTGDGPSEAGTGQDGPSQDDAWQDDGAPAKGPGTPLAGEGTRCPGASAPFVVADRAPENQAAGFEDPRPLPVGLRELVVGLGPGQTRSFTDVQVWGEHDPELVRAIDRTTQLSRYIDGREAYGRTWAVEALDNGTSRILPAADDRGSPVDHPSWCNARSCLFRSSLTGWDEGRLHIRHEPRVGDAAAVAELDTFLEVVAVNQTTVRIDGNHPHAGERFDVFVHIERVRAVPSGNRRAPGFELTTLEGDPVSLDALLGRPIVIEFFASWCPSCIKNTAHLAQLSASHGDDVHILAVDVDPWEARDQVQAFVRQHGVTWPVALDPTGEVSRAYSVGQLSTEVIIDARGDIVHVETGVADHDRVVAVLDQLLRAPGAQGGQGGQGTDGPAIGGS